MGGNLAKFNIVEKCTHYISFGMADVPVFPREAKLVWMLILNFTLQKIILATIGIVRDCEEMQNSVASPLSLGSIWVPQPSILISSSLIISLPALLCS